MTPEQIAHSKRATARARAVLKPGDRLSVTLCADGRGTVTMRGWDGDWITSATRNDIHAMHIIKVNGCWMTFRDDHDDGGPVA